MVAAADSAFRPPRRANTPLLNGLGLVLMWALFARDYSPLRWLAIYLVSALRDQRRAVVR